MLRYILKRVGIMFLTLFIIITMTFFIIRAVPGDPLSSMARNLPEQVKINFYAKYGLDQPLFIQYLKFMKNLFMLDLGESLVYPGRSVAENIKRFSPVSARLGIQAVIFGFTTGVSFGILAAFKRNKWPDYVVMFLAILGVSIPGFVTASLLQYYFTVKIPLLPTTGWGTTAHTILPTIALAFGSVAAYARYMRANVLDVLHQDYILTARAKGVPRFSLIWRHVIRNAILPAITILGPQIAGIFIGSFVIEKIFSIPGFGFNYVSAIQNRDFSMILGQTIFFAALYITALLVVDILYGLVDPRIRISGKR